MSLFSVFDTAGSALSAQSIRLNTISSNLANLDTVASSPEEAYKARYPVFSAVLDGMNNNASAVRVDRIAEGTAPPKRELMPSHPMADADGFIYSADISAVDEMANMLSASRSYQSNVEAMNTTKQMLLQTLNLGK
jgi:flagellar basal-body rod protein FlgC